jgi:pyruvate-ferredoxin/flavodoxin oxidoreductase
VFTDEEWELCPPVVAVGGDGAMYDIGFQNLSRLLASGMPIKVLVVDTQVYSNTGGQACTSGFMGQISDMAPYGKAIQGKQEPRKEIGLIAMAHRTTYVLQSTIAHSSHMIEGFIQGLKTRRPALFNIYSSCQPEHGIGDDMSVRQAKLAVESRAYPLFRYNPDKGITPEECFDLEGNPGPDDDWPTYTLKYKQDGRDQEMTVSMTFADFAITEARFRKHFRLAPHDTWNDDMVTLAEFLELDDDDREGKFPFVWSVDRKDQITRLLVDKSMVESSEDRRAFWRMLRALAGVGREVEQVEKKVREEIIGRIVAGLVQVAGGGDGGLDLATSLAATPIGPSAAPGEQNGDYMAPWIDTDDCTSCDECVNLNGKVFAYNDKKKALIQNPNGGPYSDLVKAAEKCTARVIHPGLPRNRGTQDVDKWIKRAEKYN